MSQYVSEIHMHNPFLAATQKIVEGKKNVGGCTLQLCLQKQK
jgi:hypothetical protein